MKIVDLLLVCAVIFVAERMGRRYLARWRLPFSNRGEETAFSLGLGLGILSFVVFLIGILGLLYRIIVIIILLFLFLWALWGLKLPKRTSIPGVPWAFFILFPWLFLVLIGALAPPTDWDGLSYHLAVPKLYIEAHRIYWVPFIHHSNFPFLMEMLYTIPLILGRTDSAKVFHLCFGILTLLLLYSQFPKDKRGGLLALLFLSQMFLFSWENTIAYNDLAFTFYIFASLIALLKGWTLLAGIMMGFALGTKHLALSYFLLSLLLLLVWCLRKQKRWKEILLFALPAFLISLPWYLKSYLYTGNPVYPFFYNIFGGKAWSASASQAYREAQLSLGMGRSFLAFLLLPWNITFHPQKFFDPGAHPWLPLIGPPFLAFLPLLFFQPLFILYSLGALAQWFILTQNIRYLLPIFPIISLPLAKETSELMRKNYAKVVVPLLLSLCYILNLFLFGLATIPLGKVVFGLQSREDFLREVFPPYAVYQFANTHLPKKAKIALLGEPRGFYLDRDYMWADPGHHTLIPYETFHTEEELIDFYKKMGFTHIIINTAFAKGDPKSSNPLLRLLADPFSSPHLSLLYESKGIYLFEIK